jgi:uncharacterized membrane protein
MRDLRAQLPFDNHHPPSRVWIAGLVIVVAALVALAAVFIRLSPAQHAVAQSVVSNSDLPTIDAPSSR